MDFTYVALKDGTFRYNCTIIDLLDRSVIASENSSQINTELAIRTLIKGKDSQDEFDTSRLMIHTDQGCQFTSDTFQFFCNNRKIRQSMSRAGYPYDNAPMEKYFNTLKTELLNVHEYSKEKGLYKAINDFAYDSGTTRVVRIHTTIAKHLMKFALQHNNRLQVLQFWLTKVKGS